MVTVAMKLKDAYSLEVIILPTKAPSSLSYGFSSSHVWMYKRKLSAKELMLLNCGVGGDS